MSDTVEKVTTDKLKNAGRQELGRRLGKMQKELKAKKRMEGVQHIASASNEQV